MEAWTRGWCGMEQAIYGDLYFAVNFTMDALALYLTAKLLHLHAPKWRIAVGGALGALYSVASLFLPDGNPLATLTALIMPIPICLTAFGWQNGRALIHRIGVFWIISLLLGGMMTAVCYAVGVWGSKQISVGGKVEPLMGDLPFWGFLLAALLIAAAISLLGRFRKSNVERVAITVEESGRRAELSALVDSGNLLTEPLSGLPVIVVDPTRAGAFLPPELLPLTALNRQGSIPSTARLRLIPCTTASGQSILYGYLPERILVGGQPRKACIALGSLAPDADYTAIVPAILL